jgi:hypothetical protein
VLSGNCRICIIEAVTFFCAESSVVTASISFTDGVELTKDGVETIFHTVKLTSDSVELTKDGVEKCIIEAVTFFWCRIIVSDGFNKFYG